MKETIYDYSNEEREQAEKLYQQLLVTPEGCRAVNRAEKLVTKLGLGGLWKGWVPSVIEVLKHDGVIKEA